MEFGGYTEEMKINEKLLEHRTGFTAAFRFLSDRLLSDGHSFCWHFFKQTQNGS